jgi:hypothetical protein
MNGRREPGQQGFNRKSKLTKKLFYEYQRENRK